MGVAIPGSGSVEPFLDTLLAKVASFIGITDAVPTVGSTVSHTRYIYQFMGPLYGRLRLGLVCLYI